MTLKSRGIDIDADVPLSITLKRPADATYSMLDVGVSLSFKYFVDSDNSIFECSTAPIQYEGITGPQTQDLIEATRTADVFEGATIIPKEITGLLHGRRDCHYTLWMTTPDLTLAVETAACRIRETVLEAR